MEKEGLDNVQSEEVSSEGKVSPREGVNRNRSHGGGEKLEK